jgi:general secretion pathway protein E
MLETRSPLPTDRPFNIGTSGDFDEKLLAHLRHAGVLSATNEARAREAGSRSVASVVDILIRLGLSGERAVTNAVAEISQRRLLSSQDFPSVPVPLKNINAAFLRDTKLLPISECDDQLVVAAADPSQGEALQALAQAVGKQLEIRIASPSDIEEAFLRLYERAGTPTESNDILPAAYNDIVNADAARLKEAAAEAPIIRFVDRLVARAVESRASDIHLEPSSQALIIRTRVDGVLREVDVAPLSSAPALVSRIKILARLDIAERRLPQDGAIKMNVRGREIDFRVATAPVSYGESVVVRILDRESVDLDLERLGFGDVVLSQLVNLLSRPNGIFLVTGPTGSGKSTTLYSAVKRLNTAERKIVTIEDPVEYKLDGLNQIQVKPEIDLTFARGLRSILRHDPDVIMVGEIRDAETARIAVQAALTGHLVLSTLHTNDAASAITRLLDMGVEDYLVASTVLGVLAQRLVRVLCALCSVFEDQPLPSENFPADNRLARKAVGCAACEGTGYRGRSVISELMPVTGNTRSAILGHADATQIKAIAVNAGMAPLFQDGLQRVRKGQTTYQEVLRVAQDAA